MSFVIRDASEDDVRAIAEIYNVAIVASTSVWSENVQTDDDRLAWLVARRGAGDSVLVAEDGGGVVGFAAYGEFRDNAKWPGFRFTVEHTVHVLGGHHGRGVGRALMEALIDRAVAAGKHAMIAAVDGENPGSVEFHERLGFVEVGRLPQVGWKFDRWLDLVLLQRLL